MSFGQRIKDTVYNNRGKLGIAAGIGAATQAPALYKEYEPEINQVGANALVHGHNLISPVTGAEPIRQSTIDGMNDGFEIIKKTRDFLPLPIGKPTEVYSTLKQYEEHPLYGRDGWLSVEENSNIIPIKQLILEGYSYDAILEMTLKQKIAAGILAGTLATGAATGANLGKTTGSLDNSNIGPSQPKNIPGFVHVGKADTLAEKLQKNKVTQQKQQKPIEFKNIKK